MHPACYQLHHQRFVSCGHCRLQKLLPLIGEATSLRELEFGELRACCLQSYDCRKCETFYAIVCILDMHFGHMSDNWQLGSLRALSRSAAAATSFITVINFLSETTFTPQPQFCGVVCAQKCTRAYWFDNDVWSIHDIVAHVGLC